MKETLSLDLVRKKGPILGANSEYTWHNYNVSCIIVLVVTKFLIMSSLAITEKFLKVLRKC